MTDRQPLDYSKLLPEVFTRNEVWELFADTISQLFEVEIHQARDQLKNIRDVRTIEKVLKIHTLRMLGVDIEISLLKDLDIDRALEVTAEFYRARSPGSNFLRYIEYIKHIHMTMVGLYTEDYRHFYEEPLGPFLDEGGTWYATTHVGLYYDGYAYDVDEDGFRKLFYEYAPIQLVLYFLAELFDMGRMTLYVAGVMYEPKEYLFDRNDPTVPGLLYVTGLAYESKETRLLNNELLEQANLYMAGAVLDTGIERFANFPREEATLYVVASGLFDREYWFLASAQPKTAS